MPPKGSRELFAAATNPKELWLVEGAGHLEAFGLNPKAYIERLSRFFKASLK
jgi:fermentation-respiration switch protein FrsA (DUF1100 family)